jgi:hypothetical protein
LNENLSDFSTAESVRDLALADTGIVITEAKEEPVKYALRPDVISILETQLMGLQIEAEKLLVQRLKLESVFREEVEFDNSYKNADQRKTAFDKKCANCDPLQQVIFGLNENKWSQKKITIELGNQERAFRIKIHGAGQ